MAKDEDCVDRALAGGLVRRAREGLGGSHTVVTYPPLGALRAIEDGRDLEERMEPVDGLNLYFHIPYCEHVCAFCHYAKSWSPIDSISGEMDAYLGALDIEMSARRDLVRASGVASIYVGGGTPSVLPLAALDHLFTGITDMVAGARPHLCVEVSPQTVNAREGREKLTLLKAFGVDRISLGVQTFSDRLLRRHRGHSQSEVLSACQRIQASGFDLNIDLIQDLPEQRWDEVLLDLQWVDLLRPSQVTWYILRPERGSVWHKVLRRGSLEGVPDDARSAKRRFQILARMEEIGYRQASGGRFLRADAGVDLYKQVRSRIDNTLLGFGLSSYAHGWGWFFRNVHNESTRVGTRDYIARCREGRSAIATGLPITPGERGAAERLLAMRTLLPHMMLDSAGEEGLRLATLLSALGQYGLVSTSAEGWSLTQLGRAFEEEILSLFYSPEVRANLASRGAYWAARSTRLAGLLGLVPSEPSTEIRHVAA